MADLTIKGLPEDATIVQGYFVWSGFDSEGRRMSGGIEHPFQDEESDLHDYDGLKTIGMLTVAREQLIDMERAGEEPEGE